MIINANMLRLKIDVSNIGAMNILVFFFTEKGTSIPKKLG